MNINEVKTILKESLDMEDDEWGSMLPKECPEDDYGSTLFKHWQEDY